jgi:ubiquinone/menaquinone biosynthesis C-methylase UbiE
MTAEGFFYIGNKVHADVNSSTIYETPIMGRDQAKDAQDLYDGRAANYDASWHDRFSSHMVQLLDLKLGEYVLDLACGTGLVTFKAAQAVGPTGHVVGIDISTGMLAQAHAKLKGRTTDNTHFYNHSITELGSLSDLQERTFDAIACASALVLLPHPEAPIKQWAKYLKPGGRLITDATHPRVLLPGIVLERVGQILNLPVPSYREPFQEPDDLANIMRAAGLVDVAVKRISQLRSRDGSDDLQSFLAGSEQPVVARTYAVADAAVVFENQIGSSFGACMANEPLRSEAKALFEREWANLANDQGVLTEVDEVFVGVGWAAKH